eukprot:CAMPEP_0202965230 /NCGR_PEP_ID=MMETSP1396-20130829/9277_1 /ASSEMBLY_ACC=CAM_ASM_000872 /TAXON_ID= /ORGANISM="Pseudokeronopsis sp., Strain Brazil" /LENGTH=56 /DNA_ID=CAMNT_0049687881 /DNA_START=1297 /DNA_END=1467 /DNA_ORIENTATION=+
MTIKKEVVEEEKEPEREKIKMDIFNDLEDEDKPAAAIENDILHDKPLMAMHKKKTS